MSRIVKSRDKLARRTGKNFLGDPSCAVNTRKSAPGLTGATKRKLTNYAYNLMEIRMIRMFYGALRKKDLERIYKEAKEMKGRLDENIMKILESRLASFVYRAKWAKTIFGANQLVSHCKVKVNGKTVNIRSYRLKVGDRVELCDDMKENPHVKTSLSTYNKVPEYVNLTDTFAGVFLEPNLLTIQYPVAFDYQKLIEFFSK